MTKIAREIHISLNVLSMLLVLILAKPMLEAGEIAVLSWLILLILTVMGFANTLIYRFENFRYTVGACWTIASMILTGAFAVYLESDFYGYLMFLLSMAQASVNFAPIKSGLFVSLIVLQIQMLMGIKTK